MNTVQTAARSEPVCIAIIVTGFTGLSTVVIQCAGAEILRTDSRHLAEGLLPARGQVELGRVNTMLYWRVSVWHNTRMEITEEQYRQIEHCLPKQRGNVSHTNLRVINAILYVAEHGCKWRGLPKRFGNWHTVYTRMNRWSKSGVLDRVFQELQHAQIVRIKIETVGLDSTIVKVHPDGTGALKKTALNPSASRAGDGAPRFIWLPRMLERP
jgi:transposase